MECWSNEEMQKKRLKFRLSERMDSKQLTKFNLQPLNISII